MKIKNKFGFTLIELLLAMGIIAFLATASVAILGNFNRKQSIKIAHDDVKNALAQAKSYALSQVKSVNCDTTNPDESFREELKGYELRFDLITDPDKHSYALFEICESPSGSNRIKVIDAIKTYYLPDDIFFASDPGPIGFKVLQGGATSPSKIIIIRTEDGSQSTTISVNQNGVIKTDEAP